MTYNAFLFNATYSDFAAAVEVQVNPEFQTAAAAMVEAEKYARVIGRLPTVLRTDLRSVWIHQGLQPFGGGNNNLLIHTAQADAYVAQGILEETFVHEASHTSLDAAHAGAPGWLSARQADGEFISTYARDNPTREDIAESFLLFVALRHRRDRISSGLAASIESTIPNRLRYFDEQRFNLFPLTSTTAPPPTPVPVPPTPGAPAPPSLLAAVVTGSTVTIPWAPAAGATPGSYVLEAGSAPGLANLAVTTTAATQRSLTFAEVPPGTYFVRMRSNGASGASAPSNEIVVTVTAGGCQPPPAPQQLSFTLSGPQLTLSWQLAAAGVTSFDIEAGSISGLTNIAVVSVGSTARAFSVAAPPGQYFVRIRARNGCAAGPASNEVVVNVF